MTEEEHLRMQILAAARTEWAKRTPITSDQAHTVIGHLLDELDRVRAERDNLLAGINAPGEEKWSLPIPTELEYQELLNREVKERVELDHLAISNAGLRERLTAAVECAAIAEKELREQVQDMLCTACGERQAEMIPGRFRRAKREGAEEMRERFAKMLTAQGTKAAGAGASVTAKLFYEAADRARSLSLEPEET